MLQAVQAGYAVGAAWLARGLDIAARPGTVSALVGPNGAGKSTALRLLAGLLHPSEGQILLDGTAVPSLSRPELARRVSYVPQDQSGAAAFTVRESVAMGRFCHRGRFQPESAEDRRAVREALELMDCAPLADRLPHQLSGGESRRVALARGLATQAQHLLLDEPTANLDLEHSLAILALVRRIAAEGRSVLIALHDLNSVLSTAQFAYVLNRGVLAAAGPPAEVLTAGTIRDVFSVRADLLGGVDGGTFRFSPLDDGARQGFR